MMRIGMAATAVALMMGIAAAQDGHASISRDISIPPQGLATAIEEFAKSTHLQVVYRSEVVAKLASPGAAGTLTPDEALRHLLRGTGLSYRYLDAATITIAPAASGSAPSTAFTKQGGAEVARYASADLPPESAAPPPAPAATPAAGPERPVDNAVPLETILVTGSRIPRTSVEGPAPVFAITADEIKNNGFANISDLMASVTQNLGALDSNQNTNGFTPGAQAVDLRGLGPNHTLVLVNGRRIADYPQAYGGNSNFTDISSIPASMVERVEILSGSASAIYGSDAVSGVINFILKKKANGTTLDFRAGNTEHGGGASQRFALTSGYSNDRFDSIFAVEVTHQAPLWAYQRVFTDSRLDSPADPADNYPSQVFTRIDADGNYIDPGVDRCNALSALDQHSVFYANRDGYGNYCGSYKDVGYGTLENGNKAVNAYGSATFHLTDSISLFLDIQAGTSNQTSYNTPLQWRTSVPLNGDSADTPFFNQATGQIEEWQRRYFTIEENGGFDAGEMHNIDKSISLNTGLKGGIGNSGWNYEAVFSFSQNNLEFKEPQLVSAKAQALYLGPALGIDAASGYTIYDAPIDRLYTPLTVAQFRSITQLSIDNDTSKAHNVTLSANNTHLFNLPAGPVGMAAVAEYGSQYFGTQVDPMSLDGSYYGYHNTSAVGSRDHYGAGVEFSVPVLSSVNLSAAGRYDNYKYSTTKTGKFTYSFGVEYRPFTSLLMRASYGTGFRAPDLSYLFAGLSGSSSDGTDYYLCRRDEPNVDIGDCSNSDVGFNGRSHGSTTLKDETSTSLTYGIVWSPSRAVQVSVDYYAIKLSNEVQYQPSDQVLREEADCRLGQTTGGQPVDINSGLCQQVLTQVVRNPANALSSPEAITSVMVLPINAAVDKTTGVDMSLRYLFEAGRYGNFNFNLGFTNVMTHTIQYFAGDPVDNELSDWYNFVIPRNKMTASVSWTQGPFTATLHGSRLGGLPNYDGTVRLAPTALYNASMNYRFNERSGISLIVDNLFDQTPKRDGTWTSYPYYSRSWFGPVGRAMFLQFNYRFGGRDVE